MTAGGPSLTGRRTNDRDPETTQWTVVWIDSQEAVVVRWHDGDVAIERTHSDVPAHRRANAHIRHDPLIRHGGGGPGQSAADTRRLEHLARFLDQVAERLPVDDNLEILGPGTVSEHLAHNIREADTHHRRDRSVTHQPAGRQTERQLVARVRRLSGADPARRTVGAYRWTGPQAQTRSGDIRAPRRVLQKPPPSLPAED